MPVRQGFGYRIFLKYADAEIYVQDQKKINNQNTGLTVVGKNIANPTINLEAFHEEYENGKLMADVLYDIAKIIQMEGPQVDVSRLSDYEKIKDSLFIRVYNSFKIFEMS